MPSSRSSADGSRQPMRGLRIVMLLLLVLLAWLPYRLWFGNGGQREVAQLDAQVPQQTRDNAGLQQRNDALAAEVEDLKSGDAAGEKRARNELGMTKPTGKFLQRNEPAPEAPPDGDSTPRPG